LPSVGKQEYAKYSVLFALAVMDDGITILAVHHIWGKWVKVSH